MFLTVTVISFLPQVEQGFVKVVSPKTWTVIDRYGRVNAICSIFSEGAANRSLPSYPLEPTEQVMAVKSMTLEISEHSHELKDLIVVGTSFTRGEDVASRGCVYVFEVIPVVPDPERPETGRRLKVVGKETVKGEVTGLSGIGGQGFLVVAQGQKCMVRGLKEDGSILPVAFMDMQCYVNVVRELKGTGLCIFGDAVQGLWFAGYSVGLSLFYPFADGARKLTDCSGGAI